MEVVVGERLFRSVAFRVGKSVPAPVAHGAERRSVAVVLGEGLESGGIHREGYVPVAHGECGHRVDHLHKRIVAAYDKPTVDTAFPRFGGGGGKGCYQQNGGSDEQVSFHGSFEMHFMRFCDKDNKKYVSLYPNCE